MSGFWGLANAKRPLHKILTRFDLELRSAEILLWLRFLVQRLGGSHYYDED